MKLKLLLTFTLFCNVFFINATNNATSKTDNLNNEIVANEITCSVSSTSFCRGATAGVTFTASGTYASGNVFTAQLSNAAGSFASPIDIGTLTAITSGTISVTIPSNTTFGTGYRIRVIASNPSITGTDNGVNITVYQSITPVFANYPSFCSGSMTPVLPTTSVNGITGTWSPALSNTSTTTYTFTPTAGQCATNATLTITVNQKVTPTFSAIAPICQGATPPVLPTTSINGITGTWLPSAISNSATGVYFFTPDSGQCTTTASLTVSVISLPIANSSPSNLSICSGETTNINLSSNQIGTIFNWTVVQNDVLGAFTATGNSIKQVLQTAGNQQGTVVYTITPVANGCVGIPITVKVTVNPLPLLEPMPNVLACSSYTLPVLLEGSYYSGVAGTGNMIAPGTVITTSTLLSVFYNDGFCSVSYPHSITIIPESKPEIITENDSHDLYVDNATVVQPLLLDSQLSNEYNFRWYENDILIDGATNSSYLVNTVSQNANPRNFTVKTIKGICESTSSIFEVNQIPVPAPSGDRFQSFTQGQTLADIVVIGSNIQWYADATANRKASSSPLPLTTLLVNGTTYYASQTINGFESPTRLAVTVQVALSNNSFAFKDLQVSPNPIKDLLTIKSKEIVKKVTVYNTLGQEVYHKQGNGLEFKLDLSNLVSGNYFVKVTSDAKQQVLKVIKK